MVVSERMSASAWEDAICVCLCVVYEGVCVCVQVAVVGCFLHMRLSFRRWNGDLPGLKVPTACVSACSVN